jgi:methionyl-tRNA formyltransferase
MKILFMGRKKSAAAILQWTVNIGQDVIGVITDSGESGAPVIKMAKKLKIPLISVEDAAEAFLADKGYADLVVSYLYKRRIKEPFISTPIYGCINFHPAILPDWKGLAGHNLAILYKLKEWGASAHYVDANIDTGKIIRVFRFNFDYRYETAKSLEGKTQNIQQDLYKSVLADLIDNKISEDGLIPNIGGRYISKKEMLAMMQIDPVQDDIALKCHAFWFPPYSGATMELQGKQYTLVDDFILSQLKRT